MWLNDAKTTELDNIDASGLAQQINYILSLRYTWKSGGDSGFVHIGKCFCFYPKAGWHFQKRPHPDRNVFRKVFIHTETRRVTVLWRRKTIHPREQYVALVKSTCLLYRNLMTISEKSSLHCWMNILCFLLFPKLEWTHEVGEFLQNLV